VFLFGLSLEAAAQTAGTFMPTGNMTTRRFLHCAALLADGRVLIAGGEMIVGTGVNIGLGLSFKTLAGAELYDPSTGTFTPTGEMVTPRSRCTLTLLPDGKVLAAGGSDGQRALASAELYDPSTGTFTATGSMLTAGGGVPTLLNDGRVLIVGADNELYDPATGAFTVTGAFAGTYIAPSVTPILLGDGTVLIVGCDCQFTTPPFRSAPVAELYDPATGTFSLIGGASLPNSWWENINTLTLLRNGNVLIVGNAENDGYPADAELYEPSTRKFSGIGKTTAPHEFSTATLLPDGKVLIAGGQLPGGNGSRGTDLYDPATGTFSAAGNMTTGRHSHTAILLPDGRVLIAGGYSVWPARTSSAELYVPPVLIPAQVVTGLQFDQASVAAGASYSVNISGSGLTAETFFGSGANSYP